MALTCGDDGPADYGEQDAIAFCRGQSGFDDGLDLLALVPLAVLAVGALFLGSPERLRWWNRIAFATSGLVLTITMAQANENDVAAIVVVIWSTVLIVEAVVRHSPYGRAPTTKGDARPDGAPTSER